MGRGKRSRRALAASPVGLESRQTTAPAPRALKALDTVKADPEDPYLDFCRAQIHVDYVEDPLHLAEALDTVKDACRRGSSVGLDFEIAMAHSRSHYSDVLRTVQLGVESGRPRQFLIDCRAVDSSPLCDLFADASVEKVIHSARFEQRWAMTRFGVAIENVYDTCMAMKAIQTHLAQMDDGDRDYALSRLGYDWRPDPAQKRKDLFFGGNGLAATVERVLGFSIPKDEQMSDWGRESLSPAQVAYATLDAAVLGPLSRRQKEIARELGITADVARRIKADDDKTRERVERDLREGNVKDESARVWRALELAGSLDELDAYWEAARTMSLTAPSYARLKRLYLSRRNAFTEAEALDSEFRLRVI